MSFEQGQEVTVVEMPGPMGHDHLEPETFVGEKATINYITGCCLCVTTASGVEFTAHYKRFK